MTPQARAAVLAAFEQVDPVAYLRRVADHQPAVFCELLGAVLAEEVSGALVLQEALTASGAIP